MRVLHLSFHKGCINDFNAVCERLGVECEVLSHVSEWNTNKSLPTLWEYSNQHYNVNHSQAEKYWNRYKDYFNEFDCIITSDTAPLSRIFLQNNWQKKLIIWICNRFDYTHRDAYSPPDFPDKEYYDLFRKATTMPNVKIFSNNAFESLHCSSYDIEINDIMKACGGIGDRGDIGGIGDNSNEQTLYIIPYHNETNMMNLKKHLELMNIKAELRNDKEENKGGWEAGDALIHIPYSPCTMALFESFQIGIIFFIPSFAFLNELFAKYTHHWFQNKDVAFCKPEYIEWYNPDHKDIFIYFDSWEDFVHKYNTLDYEKQKETILAYGKQHMHSCLQKWRDAIFM